MGSDVPGPLGDPGLPGLDGEYGKYMSSIQFPFVSSSNSIFFAFSCPQSEVLSFFPFVSFCQIISELCFLFFGPSVQFPFLPSIQFPFLNPVSFPSLIQVSFLSFHFLPFPSLLFSHFLSFLFISFLLSSPHINFVSFPFLSFPLPFASPLLLTSSYFSSRLPRSSRCSRAAWSRHSTGRQR